MTTPPLDPDLPYAPAPALPKAAVAVGAGGAVGALARYGLGQLVPSTPGEWPWATLVVNASGAFLLAVLLGWLAGRPQPWPYARPLLGTGLLGGYTTFSAFTVETVQLADAGRTASAAVYVAVSVATALVAVVAGRSLLRART